MYNRRVMAQTMFFGILVLIYLAYLGLAIIQGYPAAWVDWTKPYFHTGVIEESQRLSCLALPVLLGIIVGYNWYRKSMIGEA